MNKKYKLNEGKLIIEEEQENAEEFLLQKKEEIAAAKKVNEDSIEILKEKNKQLNTENSDIDNLLANLSS